MLFPLFGLVLLFVSAVLAMLGVGQGAGSVRLSLEDEVPLLNSFQVDLLSMAGLLFVVAGLLGGVVALFTPSGRRKEALVRIACGVAVVVVFFVGGFLFGQRLG